MNVKQITNSGTPHIQNKKVEAKAYGHENMNDRPSLLLFAAQLQNQIILPNYSYPNTHKKITVTCSWRALFQRSYPPWREYLQVLIRKSPVKELESCHSRAKLTFHTRLTQILTTSCYVFSFYSYIGIDTNDKRFLESLQCKR